MRPGNADELFPGGLSLTCRRRRSHGIEGDGGQLGFGGRDHAGQRDRRTIRHRDGSGRCCRPGLLREAARLSAEAAAGGLMAVPSAASRGICGSRHRRRDARLCALDGGEWDAQIFEDPQQKVKVAFLTTRPGDAQIELVEPAAADSPVLRFLERERRRPASRLLRGRPTWSRAGAISGAGSADREASQAGGGLWRTADRVGVDAGEVPGRVAGRKQPQLRYRPLPEFVIW